MLFSKWNPERIPTTDNRIDALLVQLSSINFPQQIQCINNFYHNFPGACIHYRQNSLQFERIYQIGLHVFTILYADKQHLVFYHMFIMTIRCFKTYTIPLIFSTWNFHMHLSCVHFVDQSLVICVCVCVWLLTRFRYLQRICGFGTSSIVHFIEISHFSL